MRFCSNSVQKSNFSKFNSCVTRPSGGRTETSLIEIQECIKKVANNAEAVELITISSNLPRWRPLGCVRPWCRRLRRCATRVRSSFRPNTRLTSARFSDESASCYIAPPARKNPSPNPCTLRTTRCSRSRRGSTMENRSWWEWTVSAALCVCTRACAWIVLVQTRFFPF